MILTPLEYFVKSNIVEHQPGTQHPKLKSDGSGCAQIALQKLQNSCIVDVWKCNFECAKQQTGPKSSQHHYAVGCYTANIHSQFTVIGCVMSATVIKITVAHVTLPKAVLSTVKIFAV